MEYLDIVNEDDEIVGKAEFIEAHERGLRHRSVQIFVFDSEKGDRLLICKRSKNTVGHPSKFCPSACGHVQSGQTYKEAAESELLEELFSGKDKLPENLVLKEISRYKNYEGNSNNDKENSCLFVTNYDGDFTIDEGEVGEIFWKDFDEVLEDIKINRDSYTPSFLKAIEEYIKVS